MFDKFPCSQQNTYSYHIVYMHVHNKILSGRLVNILLCSPSTHNSFGRNGSDTWQT